MGGGGECRGKSKGGRNKDNRDTTVVECLVCKRWKSKEAYELIRKTKDFIDKCETVCVKCLLIREQLLIEAIEKIGGIKVHIRKGRIRPEDYYQKREINRIRKKWEELEPIQSNIEVEKEKSKMSYTEEEIPEWRNKDIEIVNMEREGLEKQGSGEIGQSGIKETNTGILGNPEKQSKETEGETAHNK